MFTHVNNTAYASSSGVHQRVRETMAPSPTSLGPLTPVDPQNTLSVYEELLRQVHQASPLTTGGRWTCSFVCNVWSPRGSLVSPRMSSSVQCLVRWHVFEPTPNTRTLCRGHVGNRCHGTSVFRWPTTCVWPYAGPADWYNDQSVVVPSNIRGDAWYC